MPATTKITKAMMPFTSMPKGPDSNTAIASAMPKSVMMIWTSWAVDMAAL